MGNKSYGHVLVLGDRGQYIMSTKYHDIAMYD